MANDPLLEALGSDTGTFTTPPPSSSDVLKSVTGTPTMPVTTVTATRLPHEQPKPAAPTTTAAPVVQQPSQQVMTPGITMPTPPTPPDLNDMKGMGNPITALALLASLFTRQPAVTAMNALAASAKAAQQRDMLTYQNKRAEFEDNTRLAINEQQQENAEYNRVLENRKIAIQERLAEIRAIATRRRDRGMLTMLDAGVDPTNLVRARANAGNLTERQLNQMVTNQRVKDFYKEHPDGTPEELAAFLKEKKRTPTQEAKAEDIEALKKEFPNANNAELEAINKARAKQKAAQATGATTGPAMTGNRRATEIQRTQLIEETLNKIDQSLQILEKHRMAAGAAGQVLRGTEIISNILGSDESDREQFRRNIEYLRGIFSRLGFGGGGRPLAMDAKRVNAIVGGLDMGDTTTNTVRSLTELRDQFLRQYETQKKLLNEGTKESGTPQQTTPGTPAPQAEPDWDAFPKAN